MTQYLPHLQAHSGSTGVKIYSRLITKAVFKINRGKVQEVISIILHFTNGIVHQSDYILSMQLEQVQ